MCGGLGRQPAAHLRGESRPGPGPRSSDPTGPPTRIGCRSGTSRTARSGPRLVVAQPQAAGRAEVGAGHGVLGVAEVVDVRRAGARREQRADRCELLGCRRSSAARSHVGAGRARGHLRGRTSCAGPAPQGLGAGLRDERVEVVSRARRPRWSSPSRSRRARRGAPRCGRVCRAVIAVGRQCGVRPPQVGAGARARRRRSRGPARAARGPARPSPGASCVRLLLGC